jgi:hypothetical protein
MGFMVDKVALGQIFLSVVWFFPVIILPLLHIPLSVADYTMLAVESTIK